MAAENVGFSRLEFLVWPISITMQKIRLVPKCVTDCPIFRAKLPDYLKIIIPGPKPQKTLYNLCIKFGSRDVQLGYYEYVNWAPFTNMV